MFVPFIPSPIHDFGERRIIIHSFQIHFLDSFLRWFGLGWIREGVIVVEVDRFGYRRVGGGRRGWFGGVVEEYPIVRSEGMIYNEVIEVVMLSQ